MNYYEFLKFIQKSAQRKDKGKHFCFGNPGVSRNQLQSRCTIHMSLSFASGTLSCFIFQHEVPGRGFYSGRLTPRWRRRSGGGGSGRPCAPRGGRGPRRGCLGWLSHGCRRLQRWWPNTGAASASMGQASMRRRRRKAWWTLGHLQPEA